MGIMKNIMQNRYWKKTNDVVINEIHLKVKTLRSPTDKIFLRFLISVNVLVELLIGPKNTTEKDEIPGHIDINLKNISIKQFRELYTILLCYFAFLFYTHFPSLKEGMKDVLLGLTGEPRLAKKILQTLEKTSTKAKKLDFQRVGSKVWNEITDRIEQLPKRLGPNSDSYISQFNFFIMTSMEIYTAAIDRIFESLTSKKNKTLQVVNTNTSEIRHSPKNFDKKKAPQSLDKKNFRKIILPKLAEQLKPDMPDFRGQNPLKWFQLGPYIVIFFKDLISVAERLGIPTFSLKFPFVIVAVDRSKLLYIVTLEESIAGSSILCVFDRHGNHGNRGSSPDLIDENSFIKKALSIIKEEFNISTNPKQI